MFGFFCLAYIADAKLTVYLSISHECIMAPDPSSILFRYYNFWASSFSLVTVMEETTREKSLCTGLREVYQWPFLTLLPCPAWVLLSYVLQTFILGSVVEL